VTLDNGVWRRLDRVDTILVDAAVLRAAPQQGGEELDPEGAVVLDTARGSGARLLVTELGPHAPIAPPDEVVPATRTLVDTVRELQADGRAVLVVSAADGPALEAADVGIGVLTANTAPAWGADLLCGPGLGDAVRLVGSVRVAKRVSERSVRLDLVATALGWLLAVAPPPPRGVLRSAGAPMGVAVLAAMGLAWWDARSVDRLADSDATARAALRAGS
jgi:cation-transporting ATPase I